MEDNLQFWHLNEWLTIHDVACLACNIDPSNIDVSQPNGWMGLYRALEVDIENDKAREFANNNKIDEFNSYSPLDAEMREIVSECIENNNNLIFNEDTVIGYKPIKGFGTGDIAKAKIKVSAIKQWLEKKGVKPDFFFPENNNKNDRFDIEGLVELIQETRSEQAEKKFSSKGRMFLQKREWLSLYEVSCLVCDREMNVYYTNDPDEIAILQENYQPVGHGVPDDGYDDFYSFLCESVKSNLETEFLNEKCVTKLLMDGACNPQELIDQHLEENNALIFTLGLAKGAAFATIKNCSYDVETQIGKLDGTEVKISAIKQWLADNKIDSDFFFPDGTERQVSIAKPQYQTRLMTIMYETIKRYYGENYDPNDKDTIPKQVHVIDWLENEYSLSNIEAKAIDKMTRPDIAKYPKGKK